MESFIPHQRSLSLILQHLTLHPARLKSSGSCLNSPSRRHDFCHEPHGFFLELSLKGICRTCFLTSSMKVKSLSLVWLFATPWTIAYQAPGPWDFPGKSTGVCCHFLLQGVFLTQGSNLDLLHCKQMLYCLSHQEVHFLYASAQISSHQDDLPSPPHIKHISPYPPTYCHHWNSYLCCLKCCLLNCFCPLKPKLYQTKSFLLLVHGNNLRA